MLKFKIKKKNFNICFGKNLKISWITNSFFFITNKGDLNLTKLNLEKIKVKNLSRHK
jgi:hypothetical protein